MLNYEIVQKKKKKKWRARSKINIEIREKSYKFLWVNVKMSEKRKKTVLIIEEVKLIQPYAAFPPTLLQLQSRQVQQHYNQRHINNILTRQAIENCIFQELMSASKVFILQVRQVRQDINKESRKKKKDILFRNFEYRYLVAILD